MKNNDTDSNATEATMKTRTPDSADDTTRQQVIDQVIAHNEREREAFLAASEAQFAIGARCQSWESNRRGTVIAYRLVGEWQSEFRVRWNSRNGRMLTRWHSGTKLMAVRCPAAA